MWVIFDRDAATSISRHVGYAPILLKKSEDQARFKTS
jgi:hypothetical protein